MPDELSRCIPFGVGIFSLVPRVLRSFEVALGRLDERLALGMIRFTSIFEVLVPDSSYLNMVLEPAIRSDNGFALSG
ncbi:hypothetical protein Tco_0746328 [Tanacetum coccineum]